LGDRKGIRLIKTSAAYLQRFSSGTSGGRNKEGSSLPRSAWEMALKTMVKGKRWHGNATGRALDL